MEVEMFLHTPPALCEQFVVEVGKEPIDVDLIKEKFKRRSIRFLPDTECLFEQLTHRTARPGRYRLHCRSIQSFGFSGVVTIQNVYNRALIQTLTLCQPEMLIRLLEFPGMIIHADTACLMAMEPLDDGNGRLLIPHIRGDIKTGEGVQPMVRMMQGNPFTRYCQSTQMIFCESL